MGSGAGEQEHRLRGSTYEGDGKGHAGKAEEENLDDDELHD